MSLKDIDLKISYETVGDEDYLLNNFYIPALSQSKHYDRVAGFFSSSALSIASEGIEGLIANDGDMRLLISPELSEDDYDIISRQDDISQISIFKGIDFKNVEDDRLQALAWLLSNDRLHIKIVISKKKGTTIFHQKVGIMEDSDGNALSFSGSVNESANGWLGNIEEFKVFQGWVPGQDAYYKSDVVRFNGYWNNQRRDVSYVYTLPDAIKEKMVEIRPKDINDLKIMQRLKARQKGHSANVSEVQIPLYPHQEKAVAEWEKNNGVLLFEMATGSGKTRTALACSYKARKVEGSQLFIVVATPQSTLSRQWMDSVKDLQIQPDQEIIADSTNSHKYAEIKEALLNLKAGLVTSVMVYTTHTTAASKKFIDTFLENKGLIQTMFICDEVHACGSKEYRKAFLPEYDYRIGLSATPNRMYDDSGSDLIRNYFGNKSFVFSIKDAMTEVNPRTNKPFLNHYLYYPIFVPLKDEELENYNHLTQQIISASNVKVPNEDIISNLRIKRSNIIKNAANKISAYRKLLSQLSTEDFYDTIVFAGPQQIEEAMEIASSLHISRAKVTEEEGDKPLKHEEYSERQNIIKRFQSHELRVLFGMKCLDEGIDIPNARTAILLASSTNPREYIQRVGRVIRYEKDKPISRIYDLIVEPPNDKDGLSILEKEGNRVVQIAQNADNFSDVQEIFLQKGVILDADQ